MTIDQIKRQLAVAIKAHCVKVSLTQKDFAILTNTSQPRASRVWNRNLDGISLDSLFKMVENLDLNVTITIGD